MNSRRILYIAVLVILIGLPAAFSVPAYAAETYKLDPAHTAVVFRIKHLDVAYVYGRFNAPTGTFVFDEASPANSTIELQVQIDNVDTAVDKRDKHIRSADFFNADEYPLATFKSNAVKKSDDGIYEVTGKLTMLGKSRPIVFKARDTGSGKDPWGNYRRGFETSFMIKRSEFGMDFMLNGVGDEVVITVSVEGIRQ